jgi:hypothetical protein
MAVLDASAAATAAAVTGIEVTGTEGISLIEIVVIEITVGVLWSSADPLYLRMPCSFLPVLRSRLP